jgi:hypothetical protein
LKGYSINGRQVVAEQAEALAVLVLGNPVMGETAYVEIRGVAGQPVAVQLTDLLGTPVYQQRIQQAVATISG